MENRLMLNKKPVYSLPKDVEMTTYEYSTDAKRYREPKFVPDICLCVWGNVGRIEEYKKSTKQVCIKANDDKLIEFIKGYDWTTKANKTATHNLNIWQIKKVIMEEYYAEKNDEIL